jgi:N4-gp56 family major capsid protein
MSAGDAAAHYTNTTNFGPNVLTDVYLQKKFQTRLEASLAMVLLGKNATLPEKMGKTVGWNLLSNPAALSALSEDNPTAVTLTTTYTTAVLLDYASNYPYTKFLELTAAEDTIPEIVSAAGYQMALTWDTATHTAVNAATQIDAGVAMTAETVRKAAYVLDNLNVQPHSKANGNLVAVLGSEQCYDMFGEGAPTWVQAMRGDLESSMRTPIGAAGSVKSVIYGVMIKRSTNCVIASSEEYGYIFGDEAFGVAMIGPGNPMSPQVYVTPPSMRVDRAARDVGSIGSISFFVAKQLDANRIRELKSDVT